MTYAALLPSLYSRPDRDFTIAGEGKEAKKIEALIFGFERADSSSSITFDVRYHEVEEAVQGAREEDWDGYGANPVSDSAVDVAVEFLANLPEWVPLPRIMPIPSGAIAFRWRVGPNMSMLASVTDRRRVHWAALLGESERSGAGPFRFGLPRDLLSVLAELLDLPMSTDE